MAFIKIDLQKRYVNIKITVKLKEIKHKIARKTVLFSTIVTDGAWFTCSTDSLIGMVRLFSFNIFIISIIIAL